MRTLFKVLKTNRRVDIIPQYGFARIEVSVEFALDGFTQESLTEVRLPLGARADSFLEAENAAPVTVVINWMAGIKR